MWSCQSPCPFYETLDVDELIAKWGPEAMLFNERPPCPVCDRLTSFLVSPGPSTPFWPLLPRDRGPDPRRPPEGWPEWTGPKVR